MFVFTLSTSIVPFIVLALGDRPGQIRRGCSEIVRKSCNLNAVAVQSPQPPHGNRTEPVQLPCKDDCSISRILHGQRAATL